MQNAPDGCEVCSVPILSVPVSQPGLYEQLPNRKNSQQGPYPDSRTWGEAAAREVCSVPIMSVPVSQPGLYEQLPNRNNSQQGTYPDSRTWGEAAAPY